MKRLPVVVRFALHAALPALALPAFAADPQQADPKPAAPDMSVHTMAKVADLKWGEPPQFEKGAQAAVVAGDPARPGSLFVIRLKAPAGFRIARHWHPTDEHVTVLEGDLSLDMGAGADQHAASFTPGDYVLLPAKMHHAASTTGGVTLQVHGMGPFELNYVDPKDDPRLRAPKAAVAEPAKPKEKAQPVTKGKEQK